MLLYPAFTQGIGEFALEGNRSCLLKFNFFIILKAATPPAVGLPFAVYI